MDLWAPNLIGPWLPIDKLIRKSYPLFMLVLGDSLSHNMYLATCHHLNLSQFDLMRGFEACGSVGVGQDQYLLVYSLLCGSNDPPYFRSCRAEPSGGNSKFSWNYTISRHLYEVTTSLMEKTRREPDIITVHFGVWDLANEWSMKTNNGAARNQSWFNDKFVGRWQKNVLSRLTFLSRAFPETMLFYRTNGPIVANKLKNGILESRLKPEYALKLSVASKAFDNVAHVVDFHSLMENNSEACYDGLHYSGESMFQAYFAIIMNIFTSSAARGRYRHEFRSDDLKLLVESRSIWKPLVPAKDDMPCIVFLHIPKTAGTEFRSHLLDFEIALARQKGIGNHKTFQGLEHYAMVESLPPPRGFISGHWTGKLLWMKEYERCFFITVLRDPVERIRSTFGYHGHPESHWRCLRNQVFQDCRVPGTAWNWFWMDNDVVRQLAGVRHWNRMDIFNYLRASDTLIEREDFQKGEKTIWRLYVDMAIQALRQIDYVCFSDDLKGCLDKLKQDFGLIEWNFSLSHRNKGPSRQQDRDLEDRIAMANPYDLAIWNYAQEHCSSYRCD